MSAHPQPVIAGIDGSKGAIRAALWAVDEAVSRDVPLRLLYAVEPGDTRQAADTAIAQARTAVLARKKPVTPVELETEVCHEPAVASLIRASASAAMVCVGAVGLRHFRRGRVGSTAAALVVSARCPVAIIRGRDDHPPAPTGAVVVEVDGSPDSGVLLSAAVEEAKLRGATVEAIVCRRTVTDDGLADTESDRRALADLDRRLSTWKRRDPGLRVETAAVHGTLLEYVADHRRSVGLVVVGCHNRQHVGELVGPAGSAILQDAGCSLLIINRQHL
ncbi:universal stress protein [Mycobacterium sp. Marseille-P9652]|uniref:universal stress protein n=1 Tax=Mycobacterium sp. Marseille-P9652 TaxID=2654950 RepID=UPI0012E754E1|nr:universal stress protein [Mycobacterium sp. Marseille-P9652]